MASFLTTKGVSHNFENIILEAKEHLWIVSPYLKISKILSEQLREASERGVKIIIVYGKKETTDSQYRIIGSLKNIELYYSHDLHAKCYFNESKMIITSMNLYDFSEHHNREMGILITRLDDRTIYDAALRESSSIKTAAEQEKLHISTHTIPTTANRPRSSFYISSQKGFCIRCEDNITYTPDKPYCPSCYGMWAQYGNEDYLEAICHQCGRDADTSMSRPLCYNCFSRQFNSRR